MTEPTTGIFSYRKFASWNRTPQEQPNKIAHVKVSNFIWRAAVKAVATAIQGSQHLHISNFSQRVESLQKVTATDLKESLAIRLLNRRSLTAGILDF